MPRSILSLSTLAFLVACPVESIPSHPIPDPVPEPTHLRSGEYSVLITGLDEFDCLGMRRGDLVGMKLAVSLEFSGHEVEGDAEGIVLSGERRGGVVSLTGELDSAVEVQAEEDDAEASPQPAEDDEGTTNQGDEDSPPPDEDSESVDQPPEEAAMFLAMELTTEREDHASGTLRVQSDRCSFVVPVSAQLQPQRKEPGPVQGNSGGCDDEAADCG